MINYAKVVFTAIFLYAGMAYGEITNFHQVTDTLYRSGHPVPADASELKQLGVKTVLSLEDYHGSAAQADAEKQWLASAGIASIWEPMDPHAKPTVAEIDEALATIVDPANQPILVHCKYGHDRAGIVIAAYRIRYQHWTVERAKEELRALGHSPGLYWWDDVLDEIQ